MSLTQEQQLYELIQNSNNPLITFKNDSSGDVIASSFALAKLLKKIGKKAEIISPDFKVPDNYTFLTADHEIKTSPTDLRKLIISLNHPEITSQHIEHHEEADQLHIIINPGNTKLTKDHISITDSAYKHDLIIVLNTPDLTALGSLYEDHADLFYEVPVVNIDHSPENEHYGHLNIVGITATSVSEIIYDLFNKIDEDLLDENIATCLLTGMIEKTKSFKIPTVTPKSLNVASQLMAAGAERESIIKNLYQTRSVNALRLWGKILLSLKTDDAQRIAWSEITEQDLTTTQASEQDIFGAIEELITSIPTVELSVIFYVKNNQKYSLIKSEKGHDLRQTFTEFNPSGSKNTIKFPFQTDSQEILQKLNQLI